MISVLLDENPAIELTDMDGTNLVRMLQASAKKAVGEKIVPAVDNRKLYYNKGQKVFSPFMWYYIFVLMNLLMIGSFILDDLFPCLTSDLYSSSGLGDVIDLQALHAETS